MPNRHAARNLSLALLSGAGAFAGLIFAFDMATVIVLLNSLFIGAMAAIAWAYGPLVFGSILGRQPYDGIRQMTLGFFVCWLSIVVTVVASIYVRSMGYAVTTTLLAAVARYLAITAAILQITAPDFGLGLFHGRDRRVLLIGMGLGVVFAIVAIYLQIEGLMVF